MTSVTSGVGAAYYSGTPKFAPWVFVFFVALFQPLFLVVFCPFSCDNWIIFLL